MQPEITPRETVIARPKCSDCAAPVAVVLTTRRIAQYSCKCGHYEKWGRAGSDRLISRYQDHVTAAQATTASDETANENRAPEEDQEGGQHGGLFG